jgi:hypothetical protein
MLNPQSRTNPDRGIKSFVNDFRAASWIATAFDLFERFAELRRRVDLSRRLPINISKGRGRPVAQFYLCTNHESSMMIPDSVPLVHYIHAMNGPSRLMQILAT